MVNWSITFPGIYPVPNQNRDDSILSLTCSRLINNWDRSRPTDTDLQDLSTDLQDLSTDLQDLRTDLYDLRIDLQDLSTDL